MFFSMNFHDKTPHKVDGSRYTSETLGRIKPSDRQKTEFGDLEQTEGWKGHTGVWNECEVGIICPVQRPSACTFHYCILKGNVRKGPEHALLEPASPLWDLSFLCSSLE